MPMLSWILQKVYIRRSTIIFAIRKPKLRLNDDLVSAVGYGFGGEDLFLRFRSHLGKDDVIVATAKYVTRNHWIRPYVDVVLHERTENGFLGYEDLPYIAAHLNRRVNEVFILPDSQSIYALLPFAGNARIMVDPSTAFVKDRVFMTKGILTKLVRRKDKPTLRVLLETSFPNRTLTFSLRVKSKKEVTDIYEEEVALIQKKFIHHVVK